MHGVVAVAVDNNGMAQALTIIARAHPNRSLVNYTFSRCTYLCVEHSISPALLRIHLRFFFSLLLLLSFCPFNSTGCVY